MYSESPIAYKGETAIEIIRANDVLQEAEFTACKILKIIKESNYAIKFNDIGILCCGDLNNYGPLLERIFARYNIPCFTHQRKAMSQHPAVGYLLSCMSAKISGYARDDVLSMLKSGYAGVDFEDAILFEDYVLDNSIDNYLFGKKLLRGAKKYDLDNLNQIKDKLLAPLDSLSNATLCASEHLKNIFNMLVVSGIKETLLQEQQSLIDNDMPKYAAQTAQAWNTIIEILEQLDAIFEETQLSLEEILFALEESFIVTQIGILPISSDEVIIGELGRTKLAQTKHLLVLGANEGNLPTIVGENAILNNNDIDLLKKLGVDIKADSITKRRENDYSIYQALTTPSIGLTISYPLSDATDVRLPSIICGRIQDIFDLPEACANIDYTISEAAALSVAATAFGAIGDGRIPPDGWEQAISALINSKNKIEAFEKMKLFANVPSTKSDIAPRQGDIIISSVSQLEQYASCPFSYMVKYALRPTDDPGEDITPAGEGAFLHEAMERFGRSLNEYNINSLDDNKIESIMEKEAKIIAQNFDNQRLSRDGKGKYQASSLIKTAKHGAIVYTNHLKKSAFIPQEQELAFGDGKALGPIEIILDSGTKVHISGKVDRLDACETDNGKLARIVDYKSSTKKIAYNKIASGRQLQLFIYMDAYLNKNSDVKASGVFYFPVKNEYIEEDGHRYKQDQMQGLYVESAENIKALDCDINDFGKSHLLKASLNKDGSFSQFSDNISQEGFNKVLNYSKKVVTKLLRAIDEGQMPVYPIKSNNESACTYCNYGAICRKDINIHDENKEMDSAQAKETILGGEGNE